MSFLEDIGEELEELKDPKDYTEEEQAAADALEACYRYWRIYTKRQADAKNHNTAVVWIQDNRNKHMLVFTRGEYVEYLKNAVSQIGMRGCGYD